LGAGLAAALLLGLPGLSAGASARQKQGSQRTAAKSQSSQSAASAFEARVKAYSNMREAIEEKLPKLSKDATPEQIQAHKESFQQAVRAARTAAKHGDLFTPDAAAHIRATIRSEFRGARLRELRETVMGPETAGVPLRVNYPYPESKELLEMPPTLLLRLPQLPKQVRYRFVGRNLLLVDRENGLIIDYMTNALP
jgi:hypothetical protein